MEAQINITMDNDAFHEAPATELARILRELAKYVENGDGERRLMDLNGNHVGNFIIKI